MNTTRFCYKHVYVNFKTKYSGELLKKKIWTSCSIENIREFSAIMEEIKHIIEACHKYLIDILLRNSAKQTFILRQGVLVFREIKRKTMRFIHQRYNNALKLKDNLPPLVKKKLVKAKENVKELHMVSEKDLSFKVVFQNTKVSVVYLKKKREYDYDH